MRADYKLVDRLSDSLRERMLRAETLTLKTESGTKIAAHFDRGLDWVKTSGLISPRYWSNLPAGEVFTTPATVDGTFVCDATAAITSTENTATCNPRADAGDQGRTARRRQLRPQGFGAGVLELLSHGRKQRRVGELAFGTNLGYPK